MTKTKSPAPRHLTLVFEYEYFGGGRPISSAPPGFVAAPPFARVAYSPARKIDSDIRGQKKRELEAKKQLTPTA